MFYWKNNGMIPNKLKHKLLFNTIQRNEKMGRFSQIHVVVAFQYIQ